MNTIIKIITITQKKKESNKPISKPLLVLTSLQEKNKQENRK